MGVRDIKEGKEEPEKHNGKGCKRHGMGREGDEESGGKNGKGVRDMWDEKERG